MFWLENSTILFRFITFHDGGRHHIETSPLICRANQWTGFYMIWTSVMKELKYEYRQSAGEFMAVLLK